MAARFVRFGRAAGQALAISFIALCLGSCQMAKNQMEYDRSAERDRQDYRDALAPQPIPPEEAEERLDFQAVLATPEELRLPSPLVTVSVNQTVSLRDLMFELADQADVDLELDPQIRGSIIFTARNRPFNEVVDRICEMSGLRYRFNGSTLRIELDRPYMKNYPVDYIIATRSSSSSVSTSIQMSAGSGGTDGGGTAGGSTSSVNSTLEGDIWGELQTNLEQILTSSDTFTTLATMSDPIAATVNPLPPRPVSTDPNAPPAPPPLPGSPEVAPIPAAATPTINITPAPVDPLVPNPPATFSISRSSGVVSVFASERQQKLIGKFLEEFRKRATAQVLIEARVLQVELKDEFAAGIDWAQMNLTGLASMGAALPRPELATAASGSFSAALRPGSDVNVLIDAISRFGTVRALSSPRVTVLNNQPAVVNVAQNRVYFSFDVETQDDTDSNTSRINISSEQRSVPEGILLNVIPTANPDTGEILLVVRPSISKITTFVTDPTIALSLAGIGVDPSTVDIPDNRVPEVSVQEIDSALRIQSGQTMIMGGLMRDGNSVEQESIPFLGDLPFVGKAFRNHSDRVEKTELVIFLTARIVPGSNVHETDRKLYENFGLDRRPVRL